MNSKAFTVFNKFAQHPNAYAYGIYAFYVFINNTINATSDWLEATRHGQPSIALWEPFTWEYTSAISVLILLPPLVWWFQRMPIQFAQIGKQVLSHALASLLFSAAHICLMVLMRKAVYFSLGRFYDFGHLGMEFLYEYRKDAWGYIFLLLLYHTYHFIFKRIKGEASFVGSGEQSDVKFNDNESKSEMTYTEHLLVKKLDKEFLVKTEDIDYLESAGNYVNLYCKGRIYPLRSSLSALTERLQQQGFQRIHRSFSVNVSSIDNIEIKPSGDAIVTLNNGQQLNMSRRYREAFKQMLS